jgi:hypothetical protein
LGRWVGHQRQNKLNGLLTPSRISTLDSIGFSWDIRRDRQWEIGLQNLRRYLELHGDCLVPASFVFDNFNLGAWVNNRRQEFLEESLSEEKIKALEELSFSWNPREQSWDTGYRSLARYFHFFGHSQVPITYRDESKFALGQWVSDQRKRRDKEKLSSDRISRLDDIDFIWDVNAEKWEVGFNALVAYQNREKSCSVPRSHKENGFNLGAWVSKQRRDKSRLSIDRVERLNQLGFIWLPRESK